MAVRERDVRVRERDCAGRAARHNAGMSEESQIVVPESFIALYRGPGPAGRLSAPRAQIAARYEFCEDLATMLTEQAANRRWELGVAEDDILQRIHQGLLGADSGVDAAEALWLVRRLAELLDWRDSLFHPENLGAAP